jgi:hypothetical protein
MSSITLEQIDIPHPCPTGEREMAGDGATRFCPHCQKNVYDLSAMTRDDAERLVCQKAGNLCVLFSQTRDGKLVTLDYEPVRGRGAWRWQPFAALGILGGLAIAIFGPPPRVTRTMGMMMPRTARPAGPYAPGCVPTRNPAQHTPADDFEV